MGIKKLHDFIIWILFMILISLLSIFIPYSICLMVNTLLVVILTIMLLIN